MAEAIVSFAIERVGLLIIEEATNLHSVRGRLQGLQQELKWLQSFLRDADERLEAADEAKDERFRLWVAEIKSIAYQVEDLLDNFVLKVESSKRANFLNKHLLWFISSSKHRYEVGKEIEIIQARIQEMAKRVRLYGLKSFEQGNSTSSSLIQGQRRRLSYAHFEDGDELLIVGMEDGIKTLAEQLVTSEKCKTISTTATTCNRVVAIVGMGGIGKTTLARKVYNLNKIKQHFHCSAWISISQVWDTREILLEISRRIGADGGNDDLKCSSSELCEAIHNFLKEKRFLVILDDIWRKEAWNDIKAAFPHGEVGSKIMLTTRNQDIPGYVAPRNCFVYEPRCLTEEEAWVLFHKVALGELSSSVPVSGKHEKLGREMVRNCGGLPLAVKSLAGLLATKKRLEEWEKVNRTIYHSNILEVEAKGLQHPHLMVGKVLLLSYCDLPYYLRPCFLYLGVFPEDFDIPRGVLTRMWIAEGFITSELLSPGETLEEVAEEFANELAKRCLIQVVSRARTGRTRSYRVHDLIRDLCIYKSREQNITGIFPQSTPSAQEYLTLDNREELSSKPRKISLHFNNALDLFSFIEQQNPNLRSVCLFGSKSVKYGEENLLEMRSQAFYGKFKLLRVVHLWGIRIQGDTLSPQIGQLIHLRYLGIWSSQAISLPHSIGFLKNLQTLDYSIFHNKMELDLPNVFCKLEKLRHLFLPARANTDNLNLTNSGDSLQSLWGVKAGNWMLKCLSYLKNIQTLYITEISTDFQLQAVIQFATITSKHLKRLRLEWKNNICCESNSLEALNNCHYLTDLLMFGRIKESGPLKFPSSLVALSLSKCELKQHDPMVALAKLPNLEHLRLAYQAFEGLEMICEASGFPRLEQLEMVKIKSLKEWRIHKDAMPHLKKLSIYYCRELRRLPEGLSFIATLQDLSIHSMPRTFCNRLAQGGEDYYIVEHIRTVDVLPFGL